MKTTRTGLAGFLGGIMGGILPDRIPVLQQQFMQGNIVYNTIKEWQ